jgi:hypothetical protein
VAVFLSILGHYGKGYFCAFFWICSFIEYDLMLEKEPIYNLIGNRTLEEKCVEKAASLDFNTD